ncbi:MAG: membrane protein insertion efficiency factor YidD [Alphaproteobacteria bacterium]|nr:membrane protein insertion efficiency factor YidD [Alphaproteobacteria bacterium]
MIRFFFIFLIKLYRVVCGNKPPCCRYIPTCSAYAIEALMKYGSYKGTILAIKRIIRCRPGFKKFSNFGYDPVP